METQELSKYKEENLILQQKIQSLEIHVKNLRNVIAKKKKSSSSKRKRQFDMTLYKKRHVLFRLAYFGWDYNGYTLQEDTGKTIENELFHALEKTCLISSRDSANYHRCGRTDKGVSAFHQVISIDVRSNLRDGVGVFDYEGCRAKERKEEKDEIQYCKMLNGNLPPYIQILSWAPISNLEFSARFDCKERTYNYFFPRGDIISLERLNEAGQKLIGSHDFRNFCKMDVQNGVYTYIRRILKVEARILENEGSNENPYQMCVLEVRGNAFLWHQIRYMITILFRVGQGLEEPSLISELLDVTQNPRRPQYSLASEFPLNLFDVSYENVSWNTEPESLEYSLRQFQELWTQHSVKAAMLKQSLVQIENWVSCPKVSVQASCLIPNSRHKTYIPFMKMLKCPSLEEKIQTAQKRRKVF